MANKLEAYSVEKWTVFGRTTFLPPHKVSDALVNEARIVHVINGNSRLHSANQYTDLRSGDTLVMKSDNFVNNWHSNESNEANQVIVFQLSTAFLQYIYGDRIPEWFVPNRQDPCVAVEKCMETQLLSSFFTMLQSYLDNPAHLTEELIIVKVKELISLLINSDKSGPIKLIFGNLFSASSYDFQDVIQKNLFEDLKIDDLAFLTGLSLSSFKRKFSQVFGTSPLKYINSKRLERAQILLKTTDLRISEIAYECGFSDVGYFSKTFKSYYSILPSDLRKA